MTTFLSLTTPTRKGDGLFTLDVPDGHQQGRGAFGGLVLSAMARAAVLTAGRGEQTLRTVTAELCGPVLPGPAQLRVETLRAGSGTSTLAVRLTQNDEVQTHLVAVLGRPRSPDPRVHGLEDPVLTPRDTLEEIPLDAQLPPFARSFRYWSAAAKGDDVARGWVLPRNPGNVRDGAFLVGMADAWWPALLQVMPAPRPMATLSFTLDIVGDCEGLDPDAPFFHEGRTLFARDGWVPEQRTLWGEDGRLLAINHQTFVVIK